MQESPLVSILLLSMNHELYITQCIQSIKEQTYQNIEIIFLDNASVDNTYNVGKQLLEESNISYQIFRNDHKKPISNNFNFLLSKSLGTFICPFSADDWMHPENIEKKLHCYVSNPSVGALFSNGWFYYDDTKELKLNDSRTFKRGKISKELLLSPDCIFYVGIMYSKNTFEKVGVWDENMLIEDVDLLFRIALVLEYEFLDEPLVYYRRTSGSVSRNKKFMMQGNLLVYEKYKNLPEVNMRLWLSERYRSYAADSIDNRKHKEAFDLLFQAIKISPFTKKNFQTFFYLIRSILKFSN